MQTVMLHKDRQADAVDPALLSEGVDVFNQWLSEQPYGFESVAAEELIARVLHLASRYNTAIVQTQN